ncbi:MAG: hypothetical protein E7474_12605 [Ruminococcaceae bacterium]|nr:hypothetical protein [Oscillospiraceae bacterium]
MDGERPGIEAKCPLFACRICRTKTGWPHQSWCAAAELVQPECADCYYWGEKDEQCRHPIRHPRRKRGAVK